MEKNKYGLEAGRCVTVNGHQFATIHGVREYTPWEVDAFAREVVRNANAYPRLVEALRNVVNERGEGIYSCVHPRVVRDVRALLRDLGESKK